MSVKEDFKKLYNKILEEYKEAFAIYFNKNDIPAQTQYMYCGLAKDELFTDFYIIQNNSCSYDLLECAYYKYGDFDHGRFNYFTVEYEVLKTHKSCTLEQIIEMIPSDYLEIQDLNGYTEEWETKNNKGEVVDSSENYTLVNGVFYKINDIMHANEENKMLLLKTFADSRKN
jgi:hypothetical protein